MIETKKFALKDVGFVSVQDKCCEKLQMKSSLPSTLISQKLFSHPPLAKNGTSDEKSLLYKVNKTNNP